MVILANDSFIEAILQFSFLRQALLTGIIMGLIAPIIGSFVVIRRLSFIADTLSHFSLAGLSIGLFLINSIGLTFIGDPIYLAMIFSVIGAMAIEVIRGYYQNYKEVSMPIVMSLGVALSILFISLSGGYNDSIFNYLFGNILAVSKEYIFVLAIVAFLTIILLIIFYRQMIVISFDETYAKLIGIKVNAFQIGFTLVLAIIVSLSLATVGVLLVSSLIVIPVAAAIKVGKSFKNTMFIAIIISEFSVIVGLWTSYEWSVPSSAMIVLFNIVILILIGIYRRILSLVKMKRQDPIMP
jgi:zinc transport system permease protein